MSASTVPANNPTPMTTNNMQFGFFVGGNNFKG